LLLACRRRSNSEPQFSVGANSLALFASAQPATARPESMAPGPFVSPREAGHKHPHALAGLMHGLAAVDRLERPLAGCEIPSDYVVEAKQDNRWLAVRPLWSELAGSFGSSPAGHLGDASGGFQPSALSAAP
jgi:hypothetical protein